MFMLVCALKRLILRFEERIKTKVFNLVWKRKFQWINGGTWVESSQEEKAPQQGGKKEFVQAGRRFSCLGSLWRGLCDMCVVCSSCSLLQA